MTDSTHTDRRAPARAKTRGRWHFFWDLVFRTVRLIGRHAKNAYTVFGIVLVAGATIAVAGTWTFAEFAGHVRSGKTQAFDDAVMGWIGRHQYPLLQAGMLEVTALATASVVFAIVCIAGMFLWLNKHKHSAILLVAASVGGILLNNLLKIGFDRPRPQVFTWGTVASSSSFPSGHAMSAAIVYCTVAYLAARLQRRHLARVMTGLCALVIVILICTSRVYLGVHYPSDVLAGVLIGLSWAAFCMTILEAAQLYARWNAPEMLRAERPAAHPAA